MRSGINGVKYWVTLLLAFLSFSSVATTLPTGFTEANLPRPDGAQQWNEAVGIAFTPSGRIFVWERTGRVWIIDQTNPVTTPFLDIAPEVLAWHDHGMLGFAHSPENMDRDFRARDVMQPIRESGVAMTGPAMNMRKAAEEMNGLVVWRGTGKEIRDLATLDRKAVDAVRK